ncbi:MAG: GAF domain-containing protein [Candidatus Sulfotelmatobacter sp.]|jgi:transcriptional regulator with GAF, ATPase, and Fis domain
MSALNVFPVTSAVGHTQRYEALLRATNAIGTCSDCDAAGDMLVKALRDVIPFDYLELVAFENETRTVAWHMLYSNGTRQSVSAKEVLIEDTPIEWVHESQQPLVIADWNNNEETRFPKHGECLIGLGIAATCVLPLARGDRRLGVLSIGSMRPYAYPTTKYVSSLWSPTRLLWRLTLP